MSTHNVQYVFVEKQEKNINTFGLKKSMKFVLLIILKLLTIANSFLLNIVLHEHVSANIYENAGYCWHFHIFISRENFMLSWS